MQYLQEISRAFLVSVGRISTLKEKINRFYKAGTDWVNIDAIHEYCEEHHRWHKECGDHERHEKSRYNLMKSYFFIMEAQKRFNEEECRDSHNCCRRK